MALAVFEDNLPVCDNPGEHEHANKNVSYWLCTGCDDALRLFIGLGKRL